MLIADRHAPLVVMLLASVAFVALGFNRLFVALDVDVNLDTEGDDFWIGVASLALAIMVVI